MTTADGRKLNPILRGTLPPGSWNQTWIDRSKSIRVVPMKVLVLGWPRTGSQSTAAALYMLGFDDVYHFTCMYENPPDAKMWMKAIDAKWNGKGTFTKKDWDALLGHCQAVSDFPCAAFADELIATYPDAKVLLNIRPTDKWFESFSKTSLRGADTIPWWFQPFAYMIMYFGPMSKLVWPINNAMFTPMTQNRLTNESFREAYEAHNEHIKSILPPERLLLWGPQDGWEPLCKFLGVPIPEVQVPFVNETKDWTASIRGLIRKEFRYIMRRILFGVCLSLGLFFFGRKYALADFF